MWGFCVGLRISEFLKSFEKHWHFPGQIHTLMYCRKDKFSVSVFTLSASDNWTFPVVAILHKVMLLDELPDHDTHLHTCSWFSPSSYTCLSSTLLRIYAGSQTPPVLCQIVFCATIALLLLFFSLISAFFGGGGVGSLPASLFGLVCPSWLIACCWPFSEHWPSKCQSNLSCSAPKLYFYVHTAFTRTVALYSSGKRL